MDEAIARLVGKDYLWDIDKDLAAAADAVSRQVWYGVKSPSSHEMTIERPVEFGVQDHVRRQSD